MLLFLLITGKDYFSWKFIVTLTFFEPPCSCFLWNKRFGSSPYFALSPQQQYNINTKFNKNHRYYICYMFYTNFIFDYDLFFDYIWLRIRLFLQCFCFCDCSRSFFVNDFFLKKTKSLSERIIFAVSDNWLFIIVKSEISQKVSGFITCSRLLVFKKIKLRVAGYALEFNKLNAQAANWLWELQIKCVNWRKKN